MMRIYCSFIIAIFVVLLTACGDKKASNTQATPATVAKGTTAFQIKTNSSYDSLRTVALNITPQMLNLKLPANKPTVYGIVMDWETSGGIVTIVSYLNGDAGSYTSAADQVISKGHYKSVIKSAQVFVDKAQQYLHMTEKTTEFPLPQKNQVIFYMLTNQGVFKASEDMKKFDDLTFQWQDLFDKGNEVSASLRFLKN